MYLASRLIWRFVPNLSQQTKFDGSSFSVKSQSAVLHFCHLTSSVKSSWEVCWIIMFHKDVVWARVHQDFFKNLIKILTVETWKLFKMISRILLASASLINFQLEKVSFKFFPQDLFTEFHQGPMKFINCLLWLQIEKLLKLDF